MNECLAQGRDEAEARAAIVNHTISPREVGGEERRSDGAQAATVEVGGEERWSVRNPQPQPLKFTLPTRDGGSEQRTIQFEVDFNDESSVAKANERRTESIRARKHDLENGVGGPWDTGDPDRWFVGQPQPQPLTFTVPAANGESEQRTMNIEVDFTDKRSVRLANVRRASAIRHRKKLLGIDDLLRPSWEGRVYTAEHEAFVLDKVRQYAAERSRSMPYKYLAEKFNARFPGQDRTPSSLSGLIHKMSKRDADRPQDNQEPSGEADVAWAGFMNVFEIKKGDA
ncbi:hypothetical protein LTR22_018894 [Elasticomyces elasticus]|nr:hypothetical protein LTR22_018894 [Elasticomyces elasticus]